MVQLLRLENGILRIPVNFDKRQIRDSLRTREMVNQFFFECVPSDDLHSILARINKVLPLMKSQYNMLTSDPLIVSTSGILGIPREQRKKLEKDLNDRRVPTISLPFEAYVGVAPSIDEPSIKSRSKTAKGRGQSR